MIGVRIGHFEIVAQAGRGGMGEVFVAEQTSIRTKVAIKMLHAGVSANTELVQRFFNEARAVARIRHAGIVKIFDVGVHTDGRAYLIMELLEGETLAARLKRTSRLSPRATAEVARQIASILEATQRAGITHRDLKPDNVFLVPDHELDSGERVRVVDFGIAKLSGGTNPTTVGTMGTPAYMAPEQWGDASAVDWRADVYSLGCIMYEMAAGRPPFLASSQAEACAMHLSETPLSIRAYAPDVPAAIDAIALRLLAKEPAARTRSIEVLEQQLAELAATAPDELALVAGAYAPSSPTQGATTTLSNAASSAISRARRRGRPRWIAAGTAVLAIGGVVAWRSLDGAAQGDRPAVPRGHGDAPPAASDASAPPSLAAWLEAANPFVHWRGRDWLAHQVTRRELRRFLETMPVDEALRHQPVTGWDDRDPMQPVAWVTFERAAAFCRAIAAALPTTDEWTEASSGAWGLDPTGSGHLGPLQEWTSTLRDGLVVVRGGHERMDPMSRAAAATEPLMKSNEAQAGVGAPAAIVAAESIGFRCVR